MARAGIRGFCRLEHKLYESLLQLAIYLWYNWIVRFTQCFPLSYEKPHAFCC